MSATKILIVEDERIVALDIKSKLTRLGYEVTDILAAGEAAVEKVSEMSPDLILMDILLEGKIDGIEAAKRIQSRFNIPIVYLTAHSDKKTLERAKITEPFGYIVKPFGKESLYATIEMAIYKHRMQTKLKEKDENFRNLAENASTGILIATTKNNHVYANRQATEITGYNASQLLKVCFGELIGPDEDDARNQNWLDEISFPQKKEITIKRGEQGTISMEMTSTKTIWHGEPAVLILLHDITQIKRIEEEKNKLLAYLEQARKMEALGTLAGGIAHNFNNILSIIFGYTELAMSDLPGENQIRPKLEKVLQACLRARDVVNQIMIFHHPVGKILRPLKINLIIRESLKFLQSIIPSNIEIKQNIKTESDTVLMDPAQINHVFISLCKNAVDAMKEKGGTLEVILDEQEFKEGAAIPSPDLKPGYFVRLTVGDTGRGMEPELMNRIFEPYFTTKKVGEGAGMGLSVIHGIIKNHGGAITVQSEPGKGSTFQVYLPRSEKKVSITTDIKTTELIPRGHERVLFVDDEEAVVDMARQMLGYLGYHVEAKVRSTEALKLFKSQPDQFDIVITDMVMPKMTGTELAREILKIRPGIPIIICTGFSEKVNGKEAKVLGIDDILVKPVTMQKIARSIRKVLDKAK